MLRKRRIGALALFKLQMGIFGIPADICTISENIGLIAEGRAKREEGPFKP
ncbi:hypothetical protein D3C80_2223210 [compost metagenome]